MAGLLSALNQDERWLLRYWSSKRGEGDLPRRQAIEPMEMPRLLPYLQLHARTDDGRLLCRLSGTAIVQAMRVDTTGQYLDQAISNEAYLRRKHLFERVLDSGRPLMYRARMTFLGVDWRLYRRLMLPLSYRGRGADMILSLVQFENEVGAAVPFMGPLIDILDCRQMSEDELGAMHGKQIDQARCYAL